MSLEEPVWRAPEPNEIVYQHTELDYGFTHVCLGTWYDPDDPVPFKVNVEWYGKNPGVTQMEDQCYSKMLIFVRQTRLGEANG